MMRRCNISWNVFESRVSFPVWVLGYPKRISRPPFVRIKQYMIHEKVYHETIRSVTMIGLLKGMLKTKTRLEWYCNHITTVHYYYYYPFVFEKNFSKTVVNYPYICILRMKHTHTPKGDKRRKDTEMIQSPDLTYLLFILIIVVFVLDLICILTILYIDNYNNKQVHV